LINWIINKLHLKMWNKISPLCMFFQLKVHTKLRKGNSPVSEFFCWEEILWFGYG
jgi:hypothetical protein